MSQLWKSRGTKGFVVCTTRVDEKGLTLWDVPREEFSSRATAIQYADQLAAKGVECQVYRLAVVPHKEMKAHRSTVPQAWEPEVTPDLYGMTAMGRDDPELPPLL